MVCNVFISLITCFYCVLRKWISTNRMMSLSSKCLPYWKRPHDVVTFLLHLLSYSMLVSNIALDNFSHFKHKIFSDNNDPTDFQQTVGWLSQRGLKFFGFLVYCHWWQWRHWELMSPPEQTTAKTRALLQTDQNILSSLLHTLKEKSLLISLD